MTTRDLPDLKKSIKICSGCCGHAFYSFVLLLSDYHMHVLTQWFLNLLVVANPVSFMQALTEPFLKMQKFLLTNLSPK